jgi:VanZ family protein
MSSIFLFSTDLMSSSQTSPFLNSFFVWLLPTASVDELKQLLFATRKGAHAAEYAFLAVLIYRALQLSSSETVRKRTWVLTLFAWLLAILYAASDEWHQSFVPSRTAALGDVLIDSTGAALGLLVLRFFGRISGRR